MTNAEENSDVVYNDAQWIYDTQLERMGENRMAWNARIKKTKSVSGGILQVEYLGEDRTGEKNDKVKE